jgi:hypothetical protein
MIHKVNIHDCMPTRIYGYTIEKSTTPNFPNEFTARHVTKEGLELNLGYRG